MCKADWDAARLQIIAKASLGKKEKAVMQRREGNTFSTGGTAIANP